MIAINAIFLTPLHIHTECTIHNTICIYIYIYVCVCYMLGENNRTSAKDISDLKYMCYATVTTCLDLQISQDEASPPKKENLLRFYKSCNFLRSA